jgi:2-dehydropantoate 2-reductase
MRVAVMGAGGLGGYYGAMLARAGADVTLIARGAQLEALRSRGIALRGPGEETVQLRVAATGDPSGLRPVDLILFCVKAYDTAAAAALVRPLCDARTSVLSLQNGVENEERIRRSLGVQSVLAAASYVSARVSAPGVIEVAFALRTVLGEPGAVPGEGVQRIAGLLRDAGIATEITDDIRSALWAKLVVMCPLAAVGCVTRLPFGALHACAETADLRWGITEEACAVARAEGAALHPRLVESLKATASGVNPALRPSMYYDLEAGRRLELDDIVGVVVRRGARAGVPTPLTRTMYAALKPYAAGRAPADG